MHLDECIELGKECGLTTLGEAYDNIKIHAMNLFVYDEIDSEIGDLICEILANYGFDKIDDSIDNINSILI